MIALLPNIAVNVIGAIAIFFALKSRNSVIGPRDKRAIIVISLCLVLLATVNLLYAMGHSTKLVVAEIYLRAIISVIWLLLIYKAIHGEIKSKAARRELELKALNDVALAVGRSMNLKQILKDALLSVIKIANFELGFIYLLNKDDNVLELAAAHGEIPKDLANKLAVLKPGQEVWGIVAKEGRSVYIKDLQSNPISEKSEVVVRLGIESVAGTPLKYEGKTIGAITVASTKQKDISDDDRSLIGYMANLITTAVVKSQLYGAEKESRIRLSALEDISEAGLTTLGIDELLNEIADRIVKNLKIDWAGIILFENKNGQTVVEHSSDGCNAIKGQNLNKGCSIMREILEEGKSRVLKKNCLEQVKPHMNCDGISSMMIVPVTLRHDWACMIGTGKKKGATFTEKEMGLIETISHRSAIAIENTLLFTRLEDSYLQTIESLVKAIEAKDRYTCGHSECVAVLGKDIAIEMGLDEETAERIYVAGLLHDIGKIGIPSQILLKPTKLSVEDYNEIKLHPAKGYQILKPIRSLGDLAEIVLQHHERYDGTGYPGGLKGEEILLEARILAVADAYQAMISDRPYRKRLPVEEAIIELEKDTGTQFDPEVINAFFSIIKKQAHRHEEEIAEKVESEDLLKKTAGRPS